MPTNADAILAFVTQHPGRDDDEIARALAISPRQTVNQICRSLERQGQVRRAPGPSGKIANFPAEVGSERRPPEPSVAPSMPKPATDLFALKDLDEDRLSLVRIVLRHCLFPNPATVRAVDGAVFPSIRDQKKRLTLEEVEGRTLLLDDNVTPRWALLWSHGFAATHHLTGWTFAHVWGAPKDPGAYTHLANLCMMPEFFGSLSDKQGPLCAYLRFHAWDRYGWSLGDQKVERPEGYEALEWHYLPAIEDPKGYILKRVGELNNQRVHLLRQAMSLMPPSSDGTP